MLKDALLIIGGLFFLVSVILLAYFWFFQDYLLLRPTEKLETLPLFSSPANPTPFPTATIFPLPSDPGFIRTPEDSLFPSQPPFCG
jgi:hypothetical protein